MDNRSAGALLLEILTFTRHGAAIELPHVETVTIDLVRVLIGKNPMPDGPRGPRPNQHTLRKMKAAACAGSISSES